LVGQRESLGTPWKHGQALAGHGGAAAHAQLERLVQGHIGAGGGKGRLGRLRRGGGVLVARGQAGGKKNGKNSFLHGRVLSVGSWTATRGGGLVIIGPGHRVLRATQPTYIRYTKLHVRSMTRVKLLQQKEFGTTGDLERSFVRNIVRDMFATRWEDTFLNHPADIALS
jgi:hypothetical protein